MRLPILALCLACPLPLALAAAEGALPWYSALRTGDPPLVDGILAEACWSRAEKTAPFVAIGGKAVAGNTSGMLCWDDEALYIALICAEPRMVLIEQRFADGQAADLGESIEVFIDSRDRSSFIQLLLTIAEERRAIEGGVDSSRVRDGWTAKIRRFADHWVVEMAVAWAVLTDRLPAPDQVWGLNLNRTRSLDPGSPPFHCWSATRVAFAEPDRFGNLVFAPYPLWLRARYTARVAALTADVADLMTRYPQAAEPLLSELGRLDAAWIDLLRTLATPAADRTAGNDGRAKGDQVIAAYEEFLARLRLAVVETAFR
jgi:hypothetical protein